MHTMKAERRHYYCVLKVGQKDRSCSLLPGGLTPLRCHLPRPHYFLISPGKFVISLYSHDQYFLYLPRSTLQFPPENEESLNGRPYAVGYRN